MRSIRDAAEYRAHPVARTADGNVYVIDRLDHGYERPGVDGVLESRLFVAEGDTLVRLAGGTGSSEATPLHIFDVFGSADGAVSGMIRVERKPGYAVIDLPQFRRVEYAAEDELGNHILVAVPAVDWDVQSATLFYGPPDAVLQRPVISFARERDGGTTHIRFDYEGAESTLHLWVGCNGPFTYDCEGTLELPDQELTVSIPTRDPGLMEGKTYVCHD